ncbi:MAG: glycerol-3-phosphate dehydrogenase/oxidase [Leptospiraceae bacterium]|nr:glycerol-3-phosphate dehydrogenase/oxidase [Leptospiraceae bacterium]
MGIDKNTVYDVCIIGGGITGANILWDATLRGLKAVLFEKNDYASGTSQATSKMIHGGLRYLKNLEFGLVRESLRERHYLARISPHALRPLGYLLPVYSYKDKAVIKLGLTLYDILSFGKNFRISEDLKIPNHEFLSRKRTIIEDPNIPRDDLLGAFLYYDYQNINPERHTTEFIFSAKNRGALAFNYTEVIKVDKKDEVFLVTVRDKTKEEEYQIQSKTLVNATGPWADFLEAILDIGDSKPLIRSKGIHIVVRNITGKNTYIIQTKKKSHLFVIPWRGMTIIGTTDVEFNLHPDDLRVTKSDIKELIKEYNEYANIPVSIHDVVNFYGGLRPLVYDPAETSTYNVSRKPEIVNHKDSGVDGFFTALGGKYTTSRQVAENLVDMICDYLPGEWSACTTRITSLDGGHFSDFPTLLRDLKKKFPKEPDEKIYYLASRYGSLADDILKTRCTMDFGFFQLENSHEKYYPEEVTYIFQKEDVKHISDFYMRRSGIGNVGKPSAKLQKTIQEIYKKISKKDIAEIRRECKEWLAKYELID